MDGNGQVGFHYTDSGLDGVWLENGYEIHRTPYGEGVSIHNLDGLHQAIGLALIDRGRRLSGPEVRFLRHELDWSQARLAYMLGTSEQSVARWEKGRVTIPPTSQRLLAGLYREAVTGSAALRDSVERIAKPEGEASGLILHMDDASEDWELRPAA